MAEPKDEAKEKDEETVDSPQSTEEEPTPA